MFEAVALRYIFDVFSFQPEEIRLSLVIDDVVLLEEVLDFLQFQHLVVLGVYLVLGFLAETLHVSVDALDVGHVGRFELLLPELLPIDFLEPGMRKNFLDPAMSEPLLRLSLNEPVDEVGCFVTPALDLFLDKDLLGENLVSDFLARLPVVWSFPHHAFVKNDSQCIEI